MTELLITHNDLDAVGCAIVFKDMYPDIEIVYTDYKTITDITQRLLKGDDKKYEKIFFADISPEDVEGKRILSNPKYVIIDHHKTRNYLNNHINNQQNATVKFNVNYSAAYLSYIHIYPTQRIPEFILAIDSWDSWKIYNKYRKFGEDLNLLVGYYGKLKFVQSYSFMPSSLLEQDIHKVEVLRKIKRDYINQKLEQVETRIDKDGNKYWELHIGESQSGMGNLLKMSDLKHQKEIKYLKTINLNDGVVSLYSLGFDVSTLAKAKGGGGHAKAAGYTIRTDRSKISRYWD